MIFVLFPARKSGLPKSVVLAQYTYFPPKKGAPLAPPFDQFVPSPPPLESPAFFTRVAWSELRCSNQNGGRIVVGSSRLFVLKMYPFLTSKLCISHLRSHIFSGFPRITFISRYGKIMF